MSSIYGNFIVSALTFRPLDVLKEFIFVLEKISEKAIFNFMMKEKTKCVVSWSGGKDSALALQILLSNDDIQVIGLLTSFDVESAESQMHFVPMNWIMEQAKNLSLPLYIMNVTTGKLNSYENETQKAVEHFRQIGVSHFAFGDIYLENVKKYREDLFAKLNMGLLFPLWGMSSQNLMQTFYESGIKAKIVVCQSDKLARHYIGKDLTEELVKGFPTDIDICGENGEYHTFVYDGPNFSKAVTFEIKKVEERTFKFKLLDGTSVSSHFFVSSFRG